MSKNLPKFRIYAVVDGKSRGLLAEKQRSEHGMLEKAYFYLMDGLQPTEEILKACDRNDKCLYTADDREERILNEIISYAMNVALRGEKGVYEFTQKYPERRRYQEVVDRYYEDDRNSPFKDFFESAATLKKHVLRNARGKLHLAEGMAEEFRLLSPHNIVVDDFKYIRPMKEILEVNSDEKAQWFRKRGPISVDFDEGMVYRREKLLEDVRELVLGYPASLLEGEAATGKTVLVRQLGYELSQRNKWGVYYFNCDLKRDFDEYELAGEINGVKGVFILENVHLETPRFQQLYGRIKEDQHRHILFTARSSFRFTENTRDKLLSMIQAMHLEPFEQVDEVIEHYSSHHHGLAWSSEDRSFIKHVSGRSLWLLGYALEGYLNTHGKGPPESWVAKGVTEDLQEFERLEPTFPEILVAVAPLYSTEVLTEESYLRKVLGFDRRTLQKIVWRGDITQQKTKEGYVLYGLQHSELARVYWKYGTVYKRRRGLPEEYNDFIYQYATSGVPNGLEAVEGLCMGTTKSVNFDLMESGKILQVVEKEQSVKVVASWLSVGAFKDHLFSCTSYTLSDELLRIFAEKIIAHDDFKDACDILCHCFSIDFQAGEKLWELLDHKRLAEQLSVADTLWAASDCLRHVWCSNKKVAAELCELMNVEDLAVRLMQSSEILKACEYLTHIFLANKDKGEELWELLEQKKLAAKLICAEDFETVCCIIDDLFRVHEDVARELCRLLDHRKLAEGLSNTRDFGPVGHIVCTFAKANRAACKKFCDSLNKPELAAWLSEWHLFSGKTYCLACLERESPDTARELCELLNMSEVAHRLNTSEYVFDAIEFIEAVSVANHDIGQRLCCLLDLQKFANRLQKKLENKWLEFSFRQCLAKMDAANPEVGCALRRLLGEKQ